MNKLAIIAKRYSYVVTAALLTLAMVAPVLLSGSAGAEQLTARSVQPSSSVPGAAATYEFAFTASTEQAAAAIGGIVIDFCTDPIPGTDCTSAGVTFGTLAVESVTGHSSTWTVSSSGSIVRLATTTPAAPTGAMTFEISGFTNPSGSQPLTVYPRIFTYAASTGSVGYVDTNPATVAEPVDNGSVAFALVPEIDVTAIVRETLTFCVGGGQTANAAASSIADSCTGNSTGAGGVINAPAVKLGQEIDGVFVIDETQVWTGNVYYQLTTNAANGSSLKLAGTSTDLESGSNTIPGLAAAGPIAAQTAGFGVKVAQAGTADEGGPLTVTGANFPGPGTDYAMPTGVTGDYGLEFAAAAGAVRNADGTLTFGAQSAPNTPAGIYNAQYSIIATPSY